jgi:hypothetical protein
MKSAENLLGSGMDKNWENGRETGNREKRGRERKPRKGVTHELTS